MVLWIEYCKNSWSDKMATFALWWFKWNGSNYESRMGVGSREATVLDFKDRGFDYLIALDGEGGASNYSDSPSYDNGYTDGQELAMWLTFKLNGIPYYATIPFYESHSTSNPRGDPRGEFNNSYWHGWIDGVLSVVDSNRRGFYWSLESVLQTTTGYGAGKVSVGFIKGLSQYVRGHGLKLLWIPALGGRTVDYLKRKSSLGDNPSYNIRQYFDYIFCQPNYYQNSRMAPTNTPYDYSSLKDIVDWIYEGQMYIEMEVDRTVLGINCSGSEDCPEGMRCNAGVCWENCRSSDPDVAIGYAGDYLQAQKDVLGDKFYHMAYYFSTDLGVIEKTENYCQNSLGERYV